MSVPELFQIWRTSVRSGTSIPVNPPALIQLLAILFDPVFGREGIRDAKTLFWAYVSVAAFFGLVLPLVFGGRAGLIVGGLFLVVFFLIGLFK
ncbi:hypothetical protein RZS08_41530, partial [Arthrospira platensis SPKY1]|nr:hypothetical protein [Arthrospira platensis SPKY1]